MSGVLEGSTRQGDELSRTWSRTALFLMWHCGPEPCPPCDRPDLGSALVRHHRNARANSRLDLVEHYGGAGACRSYQVPATLMFEGGTTVERGGPWPLGGAPVRTMGWVDGCWVFGGASACGGLRWEPRKAFPNRTGVKQPSSTKLLASLKGLDRPELGWAKP